MALIERNLKKITNEANPNKLPAVCQTFRFGDMVAATLQFARLPVVGGLLTLPNGAKAAHLVSARLNSGANAGQKAIAENSAAPGVDEAAITPDGNIIFNAAGSDPLAEIAYFAHGGDERTDVVSVVTNAGAIPFGLGSHLLVAATSTAGTLTGDFAIVARGTTPLTGEAALADDGESVVFAAADAVTAATLTFLALPGVGSTPKSAATQMQDAAGF